MEIESQGVVRLPVGQGAQVQLDPEDSVVSDAQRVWAGPGLRVPVDEDGSGDLRQLGLWGNGGHTCPRVESAARVASGGWVCGDRGPLGGTWGWGTGMAGGWVELYVGAGAEGRCACVRGVALYG